MSDSGKPRKFGIIVFKHKPSDRDNLGKINSENFLTFSPHSLLLNEIICEPFPGTKPQAFKITYWFLPCPRARDVLIKSPDMPSEIQRIYAEFDFNTLDLW